MAAETGFTINGQIYEAPENLTASEHRIVKRYTGLNFRQLAEKAGDDLLSDQDLLVATMHIAYRREHRDLTFEQIEEIVGDLDLEKAMATVDDSEDDADPPALTIAPERSSPRSEDSSSESSGGDSSKSSDRSAATPAPTGTSGSVTSSLVSTRRTLAT